MNVNLHNNNNKNGIQVHYKNVLVVIPPKTTKTILLTDPPGTPVLFRTRTVYGKNKMSPISQFSIKVDPSQVLNVELKTMKNQNNVKHLPLTMIIATLFVLCFLIVGTILLKKKDKSWIAVSLISLVLCTGVLVFWILAYLTKHHKMHSQFLDKIV